MSINAVIFKSAQIFIPEVKMQEKVFNVQGMKCKHCVMSVTEAVEDLDGVESVSVDLEKKTATVKFNDFVSEADIINAIKEEGFQAS